MSRSYQGQINIILLIVNVYVLYVLYGWYAFDGKEFFKDVLLKLFFAGLFLGPLVKKFGCRVVCISGALLVSLSYMITFTGPSLPFLFITFGALPGSVKLCSDRAKANAKAKIFFNVCRWFFDPLHLFFDLFHFRSSLRFVWIGP